MQRAAHILVVEDESIIALDVEDILQHAGYSVTWCVSVNDALHALGNDAFDAAVLDINLDGTQIVPVADQLVKRKVPFVVCSGHSPDVLPVRLRDAPFITKPYNPRSLLGALRGVLLLRAV